MAQNLSVQLNEFYIYLYNTIQIIMWNIYRPRTLLHAPRQAIHP